MEEKEISYSEIYEKLEKIQKNRDLSLIIISLILGVWLMFAFTFVNLILLVIR